MRKRLLFLIAAVLLTGCTGGQPGQKNASALSAASGKARAESGTSSSASKQPIPERDYTAVYTSGRVRAFPCVLSDGTLWLPVAVSDDAVFGFTPATDKKPSHIISYEISTGKPPRSARLKTLSSPNLSNTTRIILSGRN